MMKLWEQDIPGHESVEEKFIPYMTPYLLQNETPHGAVLCASGGGYERRADHEGDPIAMWLNSIGLSALSFITVAPYRHPYPLGDAQRAVRLVRHHAKEWNVDPDRIGILGFSAGGHPRRAPALISTKETRKPWMLWTGRAPARTLPSCVTRSFLLRIITMRAP